MRVLWLGSVTLVITLWLGISGTALGANAELRIVTYPTGGMIYSDDEQPKGPAIDTMRSLFDATADYL